MTKLVNFTLKGGRSVWIQPLLVAALEDGHGTRTFVYFSGSERCITLEAVTIEYAAKVINEAMGSEQP